MAGNGRLLTAGRAGGNHPRCPLVPLGLKLNHDDTTTTTYRQTAEYHDVHKGYSLAHFFTAVLCLMAVAAVSPFVVLVVPSWFNLRITHTLASFITRVRSCPSR